MVSRLPHWVKYGAFSLAMLAGMVNVTGLLGLEQQGLSHLSGVATLLGASMLGQYTVAARFLAVILSFMAGSFLSGYLLKSKALEVGRNYDWLLLIEGGLLFAAAYWFSASSFWGVYCASCACGVQNALATRYSAAVVRSTHLTGIFTDLGMMLGERLRGEAVDAREVLLFLLIIAGFVCGAFLGALLFRRYEFVALLVPAVCCWLLAFCYRLYRQRVNR